MAHAQLHSPAFGQYKVTAFAIVIGLVQLTAPCLQLGIAAPSQGGPPSRISVGKRIRAGALHGWRTDSIEVGAKAFI